MKKVLLGLFVVVAFTLTSQAQDYTHALGARVGGGTVVGGGISYKNSPGGYELFLNTWSGNDDHNGGFSLTGLKQFHQPLGGPGFYWYWGFGADVGIRDNNNNNNNDGGLTLGADGVIGLEITVLEHLNLTLDAIPRIEVIDDFGAFGWGGNLGIRYAW